MSGDGARSPRQREPSAHVQTAYESARAARHGAAKWQRSVGERPRATHGGAALRRCESALRRGAAARRWGGAHGRAGGGRGEAAAGEPSAGGDGGESGRDATADG